MRVYHGDDRNLALASALYVLVKRCSSLALVQTLLRSYNAICGDATKTGEQIGLSTTVVEGEYLDYDDVSLKYMDVMRCAGVYVNALNAIHYM